MKHTNLIFDHVEEWEMNLSKRPIILDINESTVTSVGLKRLASDFKYLLRYPNFSWEVILNFGQIKFADKVTYLILDSLIHYMLLNTKFEFKILYAVDIDEDIHSIGFVGTALYQATDKSGVINREKFIKIYNKSFYSGERVYRRYLTNSELKSKEEWPSIVCSDVASITKNFCNDEEWIDSISEIASELLCNVASHTDGDCLIHIDYSNTIVNNKYSTDKYYSSVNLAVINLSENNLFDLIKDNIKNNRYLNDDLLYNRIYSAYEKHKTYFDKVYSENHFFLVTAFQNHVTSRQLKSGNGGTGLTKMIEKIIDKTVEDYSYVLSGKDIIFFRNDYLGLSKEKFIGFNKENDYFNNRPAKEILNTSKLYIPGSIYNLLLIRE